MARDVTQQNVPSGVIPFTHRNSSKNEIKMKTIVLMPLKVKVDSTNVKDGKLYSSQEG